MKILAKTDNGYLLEASEKETTMMLESASIIVTKNNPITIGQKIDINSYLNIIEKCVDFKNSKSFKNLQEETQSLINSLSKISSLSIK